MRGRRWAAFAPRLWILALALGAGCTARSPADPAAGARPGANGSAASVSADRRVAVAPDADGTAVAVVLATPGSAWELPGTEGLTHLAARTLVAEMTPALERLDAVASVECAPAAFTFTLVAPPDTWTRALDVFMEGVLRPSPSPRALERARSSLIRALRLDGLSPSWQARLSARQALYGDTLDYDPWAGPPCGVWESLGRYDLAHVRAGAHRFDRERATVALTGPVDSDDALTRLRTWVAASAPPIQVRAPSTVRAGRRYVERNTVTAWTSVAFPFGPDGDVDAIRLLGELVEDAVGPGLDRREVYDAGFELERHGDGGALIVHVATEPGSAAAYGDRVVQRVSEIAVRGVPAAAFERAARRHVGHRLRRLSTPEARMAGVARDLALGARPAATGWPEPVGPDAGRVRNAAASLGEPAIAVVGPRSARPSDSP